MLQAPISIHSNTLPSVPKIPIITSIFHGCIPNCIRQKNERSKRKSWGKEKKIYYLQLKHTGYARNIRTILPSDLVHKACSIEKPIISVMNTRTHSPHGCECLQRPNIQLPSLEGDILQTRAPYLSLRIFHTRNEIALTDIRGNKNVG